MLSFAYRYECQQTLSYSSQASILLSDLYRPNKLSKTIKLIPLHSQNVISMVQAAGCPQITTADAIQVTAAASVASLGGPTCPMLMGRPSVGGPSSKEGLPSPCDSSSAGIARFANMGFADPKTALVVLSGAHNIGFSRVTNNTPGSCSKGIAPLTAAPQSFDGHYYAEVVNQTGRKGWFSSDRALNAKGATTAALMQYYAANPSAFLGAWCSSWQEASLLGVDVSVAGFTVNSGWTPGVVSLAIPPSPSPPSRPNRPSKPSNPPRPLPKPRPPTRPARG